MKYRRTDDNLAILNPDGEEVEDVVSELNTKDYQVKRLKRELEVKTQLCQNYESKYIETNKKNRSYRAEILELRNVLKDYEVQDCNVDYWKGVEETYHKLLIFYLERIVELEKKLMGS